MWLTCMMIARSLQQKMGLSEFVGERSRFVRPLPQVGVGVDADGCASVCADVCDICSRLMRDRMAHRATSAAANDDGIAPKRSVSSYFNSVYSAKGDASGAVDDDVRSILASIAGSSAIVVKFASR